MNRERIKRLRDFITLLPDERFDMSVYAGRGDVKIYGEPATVLNTDCGTVACLAGWACAIWSPETEINYASETARDVLDLTNGEASRLFRGCSPGFQLAQLTRQDAIEVLDNLITTGVVEWRDQK